MNSFYVGVTDLGHVMLQDDKTTVVKYDPAYGGWYGAEYQFGKLTRSYLWSGYDY